MTSGVVPSFFTQSPAVAPTYAQASPDQPWASPQGDEDGGRPSNLHEERLVPARDSALVAAQGSRADTEVLQVSVQFAGPFSKRGSYR